MQFTTLYESWMYLSDHGFFADEELFHSTGVKDGCLSSSLQIDVVKVNPLTNEIDDNEELNVKAQVWIEVIMKDWSQEYEQWLPTHFYKLDCGGDTFEEAIIKLANLVEKEYPLEEWGNIGEYNIEQENDI